MNVLILTDLSEVAKNAGSYAVQFLGDIPVNFHMLNIELFNPEANLAKEKKDLAVKKLKQRMEELKAISKNEKHTFISHYSESDLVSATRKYAQELKIDLIVMGAANRGHSPFTIIGNHTYEVIKKIRCNILAVAEKSQFRPVKKIIFPIDYSASLDENIFKFFTRHGVAPEAALSIVEMQVTREGAEAGAGINHISRISNRKVDVVPGENKYLFTDVNLKKIQNRFDMIVMLGKNIGICDKFLHTKHGIYSKVTNSLPILVLHGKER
ncbi:universal stress protein [Antarcticibacterium flavum]|uniref:Universal stress protein n=1 Tax=Antarcticibacterium flavum TaxID=2058175 RepID=A0A5B7X5Y3_9FLAO|nr:MULTISPECIES: universal stress protein [Antarcticibacterium]MCM4158276.1 hypothetical protein [Antarcticibacterium sp. W02-3]QCY70043.1 universal stress protein [Antarcticibacterium flavum]